MHLDRIILIAGWAQAANALNPLGEQVAKAWRAESEACCVHDLATPDAAREAYASALAERVAAKDAATLLVGWSMGAIVAMEAALARPENVAGVVTLAGTPCFCARAGNESGVAPRELRALGAALRRNLPATLLPFFERAYAPKTAPAETLGQLVDVGASHGQAVLAHGLRYLQETDLRDRLPSLRAPLLGLHGTLDQIIPCAATAVATKLAPRATNRLLEGCGHAFPVLDPARTAEAIREWVAT